MKFESNYLYFKKLVEKSKVTCIKWLPNSSNLFLVGYASGNMYLYDASNQSQSNVAPVFTKLFQNDAFAIFTNNHASTPASSSSSSTTPPPTSTSSQPSASDATSHKLNLTSANQPSPVAKNPVLKIVIGSMANNYTASPLSAQSKDSAASSSVPSGDVITTSSDASSKSVNDFAFSPCGTYLAVVSQDGFLRIFTFVYQSNQQLHIQLRGGMKSYFGGLLCVAWSPDGRYVATGGEDDLVTVFSVASMRVALRGRGHSSWINCCAFDPWTNLDDRSAAKNRRHSRKKSLRPTGPVSQQVWVIILKNTFMEGNI